MATGIAIKTMDIRGTRRRYAIYVPPDYAPGKAWPVILFLHGKGERGNDGRKQAKVGIGRALRRWPERFPAIVVMPQCSKKTDWRGAEEDINTAFAATLDGYDTDPSRYYLTGLSMGGFGAFWYGSIHHGVFAALLPICGAGDPDWAPDLAKIPIQAFHGGADKTVPPEQSRIMAEAIGKAGGQIQLTEYPGVGHNSWDRTYGDPEVIQWLFEQRKT